MKIQVMTTYDVGWHTIGQADTFEEAIKIKENYAARLKIFGDSTAIYQYVED